MTRSQFILLLISSLMIISCKNSIGLKNKEKFYHFASKIEAANLITTDDKEGFFKNITPIDIAIQMKDNTLLSDKDYLKKYKARLRSDVRDFTPLEKLRLDTIIIEAMKKIESLNPKLTSKINLAKIALNHYGAGVFYTRGNSIFIPENVLNPFDKSALNQIILHEIWHVLSELHPQLQSTLYSKIGFLPNDKKVSYPPILKEKMLTNPDGAHDNYCMYINGRKILPIIISKHENYKADIPEFFNYIQFELYSINSEGNIETNPDLSPNISEMEYKAFFQNVKDNTGYIIHPDEIIADNFVLVVNGDASKLSSEGKKLFAEIKSSLEKY